MGLSSSVLEQSEALMDRQSQAQLEALTLQTTHDINKINIDTVNAGIAGDNDSTSKVANSVHNNAKSIQF